MTERLFDDGPARAGFDRVWFWHDRPGIRDVGGRKGRRCRVVCSGSKNSVLVEFEDGFRVVTSRWAVRQA